MEAGKDATKWAAGELEGYKRGVEMSPGHTAGAVAAASARGPRHIFSFFFFFFFFFFFLRGRGSGCEPGIRHLVAAGHTGDDDDSLPLIVLIGGLVAYPFA